MSLYNALFRFAALDAVFSDERTLQGILDFEAAVMIKSLFDESEGGSIPLNPQVRCEHWPI